MPGSAVPLTLSKDQQNQIGQWLAAMGTPQQVALRCRIVLAVAGGESEAAVASALQINRKTVRLWRERFMAEGLKSLWEIAPGRGRKAWYGPDRIKAVLDATLQSKPQGQTHWSCRLMAASQGISKSTVSNLWKSHNIKPHRTKTFKLTRAAHAAAARFANQEAADLLGRAIDLLERIESDTTLVRMDLLEQRATMRLSTLDLAGSAADF